jgi:hypothetical protein
MSWLFPNIHTLKEPLSDRLANKAQAPYFRDALSVRTEKTMLTPSQLQHSIFAYMPAWVTVLMRIRNKIVKLFGVTLGVDYLRPTSDKLNIGYKAGFLAITEKCEDEIVSYSRTGI